MKKIILDLCGGTGSWSNPFKEEFDVRVVTIPENDVRFYTPPKNVYGILAAPPCTQFSFARTNAKDKRNLEEGMNLVIACLRIIWDCQYRIEKDTQKYPPLAFWALENPYHGMLKWFLGEPGYTFSPDEFGDNYQKQTAIWGNFTPPVKTQIKKSGLKKFDYLKSREIHPEYYGKLTRTVRRSITPKGFANEFYKANK